MLIALAFRPETPHMPATHRSVGNLPGLWARNAPRCRINSLLPAYDGKQGKPLRKIRAAAIAQSARLMRAPSHQNRPRQMRLACDRTAVACMEAGAGGKDTF